MMEHRPAPEDALTAAIHDLVSARPESVRGRIVFVVDDIDDVDLRRTTESSGIVDTNFLCNFVSSVTEHFASLMAGSGMPPHAAAIVLLSSAKTGIDMALGNEDEDDDEAAVELADAVSSTIQ